MKDTITANELIMLKESRRSLRILEKNINARYVLGGFAAWIDNGGPVEKK